MQTPLRLLNSPASFQAVIPFAQSEYLYDNDDPFPLASFGLVLLNAANGQTQDCINISKKGLITSVTTENGSQYSLHSYKQT